MPVTREQIERVKAESMAKKRADAEKAFYARVTDELDKALKTAAETLSTSVHVSIHDHKVEIGLVEVTVPEHLTDAEAMTWMDKVYKEVGFETRNTSTDSLLTLIILFS